jgi:DNA-binding CsgD family transcriptional regulator
MSLPPTAADRRRLAVARKAMLQDGPVFPPCEAIQARFTLTPREAEVALLLAEGLDNQRIAELLSISPHTARRHTERVLRGLGIASRAAVAVTLLRQLPVQGSG